MPSSVVLPDPEGPTTATLSPALISRSIPARIDSSPAAVGSTFPTPCAAIMGDERVMKRSILLVGMVLTSLLWGSSTAALGASTKTVLVLGDSISAAYGIQRDAGWVA